MKLPSQETGGRRATKCTASAKCILKTAEKNQLHRKTETADSFKNFSDADKTLPREPKIRKETVSEVRHQASLPHLTRETEIIKANSVSITMC